jgi:hypothetical protein
MLVRSTTTFVAALVVAWLTLGSDAQAQHGCRGNVTCRDYQYGNPDLFYNFYVPPTCGGVGVGIYPAPLPVPAHVGHTYYTYQPLMPHEFLYQHHRTYHRYYNEGRGLTRTSVHWW